MVLIEIYLTHFCPMVPSYTPFKYQNSKGFLVFSGNVNWEHLREMIKTSIYSPKSRPMLAQRNLPIIEMAEYLFHLDVIATSDTIIPSPSITTKKKMKNFNVNCSNSLKQYLMENFFFVQKVKSTHAESIFYFNQVLYQIVKHMGCI